MTNRELQQPDLALSIAGTTSISRDTNECIEQPMFDMSHLEQYPSIRKATIHLINKAQQVVHGNFKAEGIGIALHNGHHLEVLTFFPLNPDSEDSKRVFEDLSSLQDKFSRLVGAKESLFSSSMSVVNTEQGKFEEAALRVEETLWKEDPDTTQKLLLVPFPLPVEPLK